MPHIVARGTLTAGFSTRAAAMLAHSKPSSANSVSAAAPRRSVPFNSLITSGRISPLPVPSTSAAITITATSGTSFSSTVTIWNWPAARTPRRLTSVIAHTSAMAQSAGAIGVAPMAGIKAER